MGRPAAGGALQADLPRARARGQPPLAPALLQGDPHLGGGAGEAGGGAGETGDQYEQAAQQATAGDQQEAPPHLARQGPGGHGAGGVTVTSEIIVEIMQEQGDIQHDHNTGEQRHHAGAGDEEVMTGQFGTPGISLPDTGHMTHLPSTPQML